MTAADPFTILFGQSVSFTVDGDDLLTESDLPADAESSIDLLRAPLVALLTGRTLFAVNATGAAACGPMAPTTREICSPPTCGSSRRPAASGTVSPRSPATPTPTSSRPRRRRQSERRRSRDHARRTRRDVRAAADAMRSGVARNEPKSDE